MFKMDDKIFEFAYRCALRDATLMKAYSGDKVKLSENEKARQAVHKYIESIMNEKQHCFYKAADDVLNAFNGDEYFTFGNAQKLINMTAKYLYIMCYGDEAKRKLFSNCHCPMDRIMIAKVVGKYRKLTKENKDLADEQVELFSVGDNLSGQWSSVSWSNIKNEKTSGPDSIEVYKKYQEMVNALAKEEHIMPLEYDYKHYYD